MTPKNTVAELRALLDKATPGPWDAKDESVTRQIGTSRKWVAEAKGWAGDGHREFPQTVELATRDAALIAALRNAAPDLLRVVEAAQELERRCDFSGSAANGSLRIALRAALEKLDGR